DIFGIPIYNGAPEDSASFWTGYFNQFGSYSAATSKRVESPTIDCSGKNNINISFVYYEGGDDNNGDLNGDASLWYYDGSTWAKINDLVKMVKNPNRQCYGTEYGAFSSFT